MVLSGDRRTGVSVTSNRAFGGLDGCERPGRMLRTQPRLLALSAWAGTRLTNIQTGAQRPVGGGDEDRSRVGLSGADDRPERGLRAAAFSPNSLTQSVSYRVIRYDKTDNTIAAEATGTITTNLPPVGTLWHRPCA